MLLSVCFAAAAFADEKEVEAERGITTFGVVSSDEHGNLAFTVPLYVTFAVIKEDGASKVLTPSASSYCLTNVGISGYMAVSALELTGIGNQQLRFVSGKDIASYAGSPVAMALSVGGQDFPAGSMIAEKTTNKINITKADLLAGTSGFVYQHSRVSGDTTIEETKFNPIKAKIEAYDVNTLPIELSGVVSKNWLTGSDSATDSFAATPQWKLQYTISRCDSVGNLIDTVQTYSGAPKNYTDFVWNTTTKEFEPKS